MEDAKSNSRYNPTDDIPPNRRKEFGRPFDPKGIEKMSFGWFTSLWEKGADQRRVGEILFFTPAVSKGIRVNTLLAFSRGLDLLTLAEPEILARFPAPDLGTNRNRAHQGQSQS